MNERYALTGAQCLDGYLVYIVHECFVHKYNMSVDFSLSTRDLTVRSGSVDVNGGEFHKIINIFLHENYDQFNAVINDIAVFEVLFL